MPSINSNVIRKLAREQRIPSLEAYKLYRRREAGGFSERIPTLLLQTNRR